MNRFLSTTALALMLGAAPAHAMGHEMGLSGGLSMPTGDFHDAAGTGFNIGGEYQYMITNLGVGASIAYHSWGATDETNDAAALAFGSGSEMSFKTWQYSAYGVWAIPTPTMTPAIVGWTPAS